jgi:hypothetical protein
LNECGGRRWNGLDDISREVPAKVDADAAELGISSEELVERLLRDDE